MKDALLEALNEAFAEDVYKCVLSNPTDKQNEVKKMEFSYLDGLYHIEKYTDTQVFHEKMTHKAAKRYIESLLGPDYKSLNSWNTNREYSIKISKKGKVLFYFNAIGSMQAPRKRMAHNREKNYILGQGLYIEPLVDMGILTKDGQVVHSMFDKYRQINRFIEIVDDEVRKTDKTKLTILDFGCGKSYLTFVLYYYFTEIKQLDVDMVGLDLKKDVIDKCNTAAQKYGYGNLTFEVGDISNYEHMGSVDIVISLHACDTATDYALYNAICWNADMIFSVPCCQHEINNQIQSDRFSGLIRYGIIKERMSSLITDTIRCNLLECCGYKTQMVEFVAFDHTPKNIMIRAAKRPVKSQKARLAEVDDLMKEFHLNPTLYRLLRESNHL